MQCMNYLLILKVDICLKQHNIIHFYFRAIKSTPKKSVEAINPTPTKVAIILVFKYTFTVASSLPSFLAIKKFTMQLRFTNLSRNSQ